MSSHKGRIARLEQVAPDKRQFVCVMYPGQEAQGFSVSDAQGGSRRHFDTREELEAFEARPDVELIVLEIVYASHAEERSNE